MKNLKATIRTEEIIKTVIINVNACIDNYNNDNDAWKGNLKIVDKCISALIMFSPKHKSDYSQSWNEIKELTGYSKLFEIQEIAEEINRD